MSEHAWVLENIASFSAGGLEAAECERLQQHIAVCEPCTKALTEARNIDRTLEALFAGVRPDPALEDRAIRSLRAAPRRRILRIPFPARIAGSAAAVVLLGVLGAGLSSMVADGSLPFPGMPTAANTARQLARNNLKQLGLATHTASSKAPADLRDPEDTEGLTGAELAARGYYPPSRALIAKGNSKIDSNLGDAANPAPPPGESGAGTGRIHSSSVQGVVDADVTAESAGKVPVILDGSHSMKVAPGTTVTEATVQNLYTYRNDQPASQSAQRPFGFINSLPASQSALPPTYFAAFPKGSSAETHFKLNDQFMATLQDPKTGETKGEQKPKGNEALPKPVPEQQKASDDKKAEPAPPAPVATRKIIRSGDIEFEIESFDSSVAAITKLVNDIKGGFIATVNSEKLPNGKVRGSVVVRVPPERLDTLILDLRKELGRGGELKSLRIGSQDITKQYTDMESRLRAARAMEERLLQIIKTGKGEIKDLLQAEKELGVWRTKIEELEGELRYYANLVALSTVTITLYEKEIRAPFAVIETERIQMGIEVEDVDKAQQQTLAAVGEAKGRITKSELKQHAAGQFNALLQFEVAPAAAGPLRDRLKQLGTVARLEIDRLQQTEGGSGRPQDAKSKRNDTQFFVSLYNLANIAPRETVHLNLVCEDVEAVYKAILARVEKSAGRIVTSNLNRQKSEQITGTIQFEVRAADADAVLLSLKEAGEVMLLQVTENPDVQNVTKSKRGFRVELWALGQVEPRETAVLQVATQDVPAGYRSLREAVTNAKGRMLNAQLNQQDKQNITAQLDFDIRRAEEAAIDAVLSKIGDIYSRNVIRAQDNPNVIDSKVRLKLSLVNVASLKPRENFTLTLEVPNVENTAAALSAMVSESQGRTVEPHFTHRPDGSVVAKLVFDVPLAKATGLVDKFKRAGTLQLLESSQNPQVPESALAIARLDVTLSNTKLIVPSDDGLWPQVRKGLSNSLLAIFWSLSWVIFGMLFVLPWALVIYGIYRIVLRILRKTGSATTVA